MLNMYEHVMYEKECTLKFSCVNMTIEQANIRQFRMTDLNNNNLCRIIYLTYDLRDQIN